MVVFRFFDWPLRAKMAALLAVASLLPLGVAAFIDIRGAEQQLLANMEALLAARGDQLVGELDAFHRGYQRSVDRLAHLPDVVEFCRAGPDGIDRLKPALRAVLDVWPVSDAQMRGVAILDVSGAVRIATEDQLIGTNLSDHGDVREALRGTAVISDIYVDSRVGDAPTIAYLTPVFGPDRGIIGLVALWVRATSFWDIARASNERAGPGSFAVLFDRHGIRIAHTYDQDIVFHPGGPLDAGTVSALVAERRFGEKTHELLQDVRAFPEQFDRARAKSPDRGVFRGFAPVNQKWNYGVGRRFQTVSWTVFYMIPEGSLTAHMAAMTRRKIVFAGVIILIALITGTLCAAVILKPIRALSKANESLARGDLATRVQAGHADELGRLGMSFNSMAEQIEAQATALRGARDELEVRVRERTTELVQTTSDLELEIVERKRAEEVLAKYAERLGIMHEIDRAVIAAESPVKIAEAVLRPVQKLLGAPRVIVNLFDLETGEAEWLAAAGRGRVRVGPGVRFPLALMGNVDALRRGEPQVIDVDALPPSPELEALLKSGVRVYMVVPMIAGGELIGGLSFGGSSREFSPDQIAVAEEVARQMAIAIEQSRLLERVTRHAAELEERVRARTAELEAAQAELVRKERLATLGQLAGSVAHELRNPLGVIKNAAYFLRMTLSASDEARVRKHLATLEREVAISDRIITELLDFARSPGARRVPAHLNDVVREYLDRVGAPEGDVELVLLLTDDLPGLAADPLQLGQILGNLVRNAVQAMPNGGRLTIETAQQADGALTLGVADTGAGISPEARAHVFEPLFTTKAKGVGLGLAIVKQLTEANGGTVDVESVPGQGSRFSLRFPR